MLRAREASLTTLRKVPVGHLIFTYGLIDPGQMALTISKSIEDDASVTPLTFLLGPHFFLRDEDHRLSVIDLGLPVVEFDPSSIVAPDAVLVDGTLVFVEDRIGVYEAAGQARATGNLADLSGGYKELYRRSQHPAFSRWSIGIMRGDDFVSLKQIDVGPKIPDAA